jgi:hypothetical protein
MRTMLSSGMESCYLFVQYQASSLTMAGHDVEPLVTMSCGSYTAPVFTST